jgi:hypothetical protein
MFHILELITSLLRLKREIGLGVVDGALVMLPPLNLKNAPLEGKHYLPQR